MFKVFRDAVFNLIPLKFHLLAFYYYYKYSSKLEPELISLPKFISARRVSVDIGANRGLYTYFLSGLFNKVVSFEPQPWCCAKIAACNRSNISAFNVGLSDHAGSLDLYIPKDAHGTTLDGLASFRCSSDAKKLEVPVKKLDDYDLKEVDFIKIDVEGHEYEVLEGAVQTISRNKPVLLIEIEQRHLNRPMGEIFDKITNLGYEGFFLQENKQVSIKDFSYKTHQQPFLTNVFDKRYINNFFFIPTDGGGERPVHIGNV